MRQVFVVGFTDHRDSYTQGDIHLREVVLFDDENPSKNALFTFKFDENATYEEIVKEFVQTRRLPPLDDPRLRYNLVLQVFERHYDYPQGHYKTTLFVIYPKKLAVSQKTCHAARRFQRMGFLS